MPTTAGMSTTLAIGFRPTQLGENFRRIQVKVQLEQDCKNLIYLPQVT